MATAVHPAQVVDSLLVHLYQIISLKFVHIIIIFGVELVLVLLLEMLGLLTLPISIAVHFSRGGGHLEGNVRG